MCSNIPNPKPMSFALVTALVLGGVLSSPRTSVARGAGAGDGERTRARLLLSRATFGPRPADLEAVLSKGTDAWLEEQLHPERIDDAALSKKLAPFGDLQLSTADLMKKYPRPDRAQRESMQEVRSIREKLASGEPVSEDERAQLRRMARKGEPGQGQVLMALSEAKLVRAVTSERQLEEVMVDFWFNHFNVYARKNRNVLLALPSYERDAIRPHALGKFEDLLLATAQHPAMLFYLDNWLNTKEGFDPRRAMRSGGAGIDRPPQAGPSRERRLPELGINENYAREILELHTLGVDGGYRQKDVVEVARALTGWSVVVPRLVRMRERMQGRGRRIQDPLLGIPEVGTFTFNRLAHDEGPKSVLGKTIEAGGIDDGLEVIHLLGAHPSTARFISTKLARRFVSDSPSEAIVSEMSARFVETGGDIGEVLATMFRSPRFLEEALAGAKVKTPLELVVSSIRATGAAVESPAVAQAWGPRRPGLVRALEELGMPLYLCQPPTGYDEEAASWISAGNLLTRVRFTGSFVAGELPGVSIPIPPADLDGWTGAVLPGGELELGSEDEEALAEALAEFSGLPRSANTQAMALVLASPAFQRQ